MLKIMTAKHLIFIIAILLLGIFIAYQFNWQSKFDYSQTIRNQLDNNKCEINGCNIAFQNIDKWVYFKQFNFDFSEQCESLVIDDKLKSYMEDNIQCDFLVGFKDNQARKFIKGYCQSGADEGKIFFEKYLTPTEFQNTPMFHSDRLADIQAIADIEGGDVFKPTIIRGIKVDGSFYMLNLRKIDNISNLKCF